MTEVGTVELWCQSRTDDRRWRLQIQLRGAGRLAVNRGPIDRRRVRRRGDRAIRGRRRRRSRSAPPSPPRPDADEANGPPRLIKKLEELLDAPRDSWPPSALRALWEPLRDSTEARLKGPRHESRWFNLAGFCLRPGTGYPLDENRIKALWPVFHQGVKHLKDIQCWADWWVLWRRVAAGLNRAHHEEIHRRLVPVPDCPRADRPRRSSPDRSPRPTSSPRSGGARPRWNGSRPSSRSRWATPWPRNSPGRPCRAMPSGASAASGARVPLYGPANAVVPPEKAARWARALLDRAYAPGRESADADLRPRRRSPGSPATAPETSTNRSGPRSWIGSKALGADEEALRARPRVPRTGGRPARAGPRRCLADGVAARRSRVIGRFQISEISDFRSSEDIWISEI